MSYACTRRLGAQSGRWKLKPLDMNFKDPPRSGPSVGAGRSRPSSRRLWGRSRYRLGPGWPAGDRHPRPCPCKCSGSSPHPGREFDEPNPGSDCSNERRKARSRDLEMGGADLRGHGICRWNQQEADQAATSQAEQ